MAAQPQKAKLNDLLGDQPAEPAPETQQVDEIERQAPRSVYSSSKQFDASEVMTPRLALAQGLSPEVRDRKADVGQWLLMGHEPVNEVRLVIAGHATQRRYVPEGQQRAQCWSPDGVQGHGDPGIKCEDCPLSKWTNTGRKGPDGRVINARPPCDEVDSFVAFSLTHGMPVTWPLKGTGSKAARFLKTLSNGLGMGNFAVTVTAEGKSAGSRAWHEPAIKIDPSITKDEANVYADIARGAVPIDALPAEAGA